jgi:glycine cleavage system transcriptional repressor
MSAAAQGARCVPGEKRMSVTLVSILTQDRVGLVSEIADLLFEAGVNLGDTTFAVLGSGAQFTAVCELPPGLAIEALEQGLTALPTLADAQVRVVPYMFDGRPETGTVTHRITISGGDQLGLVARLSQVFAQHSANIVRLEARKLSEAEGGLYVTRFAVSIPPDRANPCLATVANTAGSLGLASRVEDSKL